VLSCDSSFMRWRKLLVPAAIFAAILAIILALPPQEPKYGGRTLSEWIRDSGPRLSPEPETARAIEAVRHIGTNALPWLIEWLNYKEPPAWKLKLLAASAKLPPWLQNRVLPNFLLDRSYQVRRRLALDGFLILGPQASPAVPDLLKIRDPWSTGALESIGLASLEPTLGVLTNRANSPTLRATAANWLGSIDEKFELTRVVPVLAQCVRESQPSVAKESAKALVKLGAEPELTVSFFADLLQHGDVISRCEAAENLRVLHEKARAAVPALVIATKDTDWYVRRAAIITLYKLDPDSLEKPYPAASPPSTNPTPLGISVAADSVAADVRRRTAWNHRRKLTKPKRLSSAAFVVKNTVTTSQSAESH
jgi:HEAT repeat protein